MKKKQSVKIDYVRLLSDARQRKSSGAENRSIAIHAASDRGRVLFSTAFRRLQSKTQVFPQEWNAAVRTRLTHSMEVASIGRYIAEGLSETLLQDGSFGDPTERSSHHRASAFITFVEVACLMHDLGNPPFGHFGETSIQEWFAKKTDHFGRMFPSSVREEFIRRYRDFDAFDGNPQGFRLATRLQWVNDEFGYNLTYTQLAATLKYPWTPERIGEKQDGVVIKKAGVFHSEAGILEATQIELGLEPFARHPLAYLMEAADDISYCLSDIEDALEKGVVRSLDVIEVLRNRFSELKDNKYAKAMLTALPAANEKPADASWFVDFRTTATNNLVNRARELYQQKHKKIAAGQYFSLLRASVAAKALLEVVEGFSRQHLYCSHVVRERELVGYQVICGILDKFGIILDLATEEAEALLILGNTPKSLGSALAPTLRSFLPRKHLKVYEHALREFRMIADLPDERFKLLEWMARAHLIVDFLSGMTDDFAIVTYRRLYDGGIKHI
ncbi:dGTPase [Cupriavidus pauculus]|uniref:dGTPase n=1 Tax=Cupriavidus pauculus TaxID=82633 RepID=UPI001C935EC4|nr:dGTPase [Cupriavidus pauculus]MBY4731532.1 dGTPase [Cupriavidus pauculus]